MDRLRNFQACGKSLSGPSDTRAPARFRWEVIYAGVQDLLNNLNVGGDRPPNLR